MSQWAGAEARAPNLTSSDWMWKCEFSCGVICHISETGKHKSEWTSCDSSTCIVVAPNVVGSLAAPKKTRGKGVALT